MVPGSSKMGNLLVQLHGFPRYGWPEISEADLPDTSQGSLVSSHFDGCGQ